MANRIKCVFSVARTEYVKWITNPRIIIMGVLLVFMRSLAVEPLLERADKFGEKLNAFEPFIAIGNSGMLVMLMPCVFLILISDYPKMTGNTLFFIKRTGKANWFLGQILFICMAITTFVMVVLFGGMLVSQGFSGLEWSNTVTKYSARFPMENGNFASQLIPSNLYNQMSLLSSVLQTAVLVSLYLFLLSMVIYFFKLIHIQALGLLVAVFIVAGGAMTFSLNIDIMWAFPMANTLVWLHFREILSSDVFSLFYSYIYFFISIVLMLFINIIAVVKLQFFNIELVE